MYKNFNITQLVSLSLIAITLVTIIINFINKINANRLINSLDWVSHTYIVQSDLKDVEKTLVDAETGQRGFIYINREEYLQPYNLANQRIKGIFSKLKNEVRDNPD